MTEPVVMNGMNTMGKDQLLFSKARTRRQQVWAARAWFKNKIKRSRFSTQGVAELQNPCWQGKFIVLQNDTEKFIEEKLSEDY